MKNFTLEPRPPEGKRTKPLSKEALARQEKYKKNPRPMEAIWKNLKDIELEGEEDIVSARKITELWNEYSISYSKDALDKWRRGEAQFVVPKLVNAMEMVYKSAKKPRAI
jgi:hypothetical protein